MDRLSLAFFAAAFVIAGSAVAGLALRAGVGTRVADASVAAVPFEGVVAGGSTRANPEALADVAFPDESIQSARAADTRIAAATLVTAPNAARRNTTSRTHAVDAVAVVAAPAPAPAPFLMDFPVPRVEACAAAMFVPGIECAEGGEIDPAAIEAAVEKAHEVAERVRLRTHSFEHMQARIRRIERERARSEGECAKKRVIVLEGFVPTQG